MPSDQSIDSISLQIGADAQSAEDSIDKLCTSLNTLKRSLSNVGKYSNQLSLLSSSLSSLSLLNTAKLSSVAKSVSQMGSINVKASGINLLTNSLTRLVKESANFDPSKMNQIQSSLQGIANIGNASESMIAFVKSLNSFVRSGEKMKETAQEFPALAQQLQQFFQSMQNVTVSDNTVRMAEALAMIAKSGAKAGVTMNNLQGQTSGLSKSMRLATGIVNGLENGLKSLLNIAKKLGSGALTGLKNLFMQISGLGKSSTAVTGLTANIKTLLGTMLGFHGIVGLFNWSKQMMTMGADVTEIDHIVKSVFGEEMVGEVEAWANEAVEKFGIASTAAKQYAGTMSAMFQASNIARQDANKMSTDLVGLAGDLSAFYNIDTETAYNKIKSGMAGMVRPLRDLGIDLSVATLKEYALAQGITKSWTEMTQAEKVMLRYRYLMDNTKQQQGDFARTNLSLANSFRTLRAYLAEITRQIGVGLGAAIRHAVVGLNILMKYVLKATQAFATFMQKIFGKYEGGASFVDMDMSGMSDDMGDFADGADNAADGLDDAADSAEKLKKDLSVLPFDELNQLNKDQEKTSSSKGKGTGSGDGIGGLGDVGDFGDGMLAQAVDNAERELTDFEKFLKDWHDKCAQSLNAKDWEGLGANIAWGLNKGIETLYDALDPEKAAQKINPWLDAFSTTVNSLTKHLEWEKMGGAIGRGITILVNAANRLLDPETGIDFEGIGNGLGGGFMGAVRNINWTGVGNLISNKFMVGWRIFKGFVDELDATDIGEAIRDTIGGVIDKLDTEVIGSALGNFVEKVATAIKIGFGEKKHWTTLGQKLADGLKTFFRAVKGKDIADAINVLMDAILTTLGTVLEDDELKSEVAKDVGDFIVNVNWGNVGKLAAPLIALKLLGGLWTPFKTSLLTGITAKASGFFNGFTVPGFVSGLSTALLYANPAMLGKIGDDAWNIVQKTVIGQFLLDVDSSIDEIFWSPLMNLFSFERARSHWETARADFSTGGMNAVLGIGEGFQAGYWAISEPVYNLFDTFMGGILGIFTGQTPLITESAAEMARGIDGAAVTAAQNISTATTDAKNTLSTNLTEMQTKEGEYATATSTSAYTATTAYQNIVDKLGVLGQQHHTDLVENAKSAVETFESAVTQGATSMSSSWYTLTQDEQGHTQSLVESLKEQTQSIQTWEQDLITLSRAGVDEGFLTELARMGTEGTPAVQSALEQIKKEGGVEELNSSWQALINAQGMMDDVGKTLKEAGVTNISESFGVLKEELESNSKNLPDGIKSGLEQGAPLSIDAMEKLADDMNNKYRTFWRIGSPSKEMEDRSGDIVDGIVDGIDKNSRDAENAMEDLADRMMDAFKYTISLTGIMSDALSALSDAVDTAYNYGADIGQALANGISSITIPCPSIDIPRWDWVDLGDGAGFSVPYFEVNWYKRGGLFTDATIAGFGEAGNEAALPLENKRAMHMIASAIIDGADGGFGMNADEMANAVARGYAMAQMMNQANERPIQVNATLYTENNEVLARAVTKGQKSIDYRNNATPKLSY